MDEILKNLLTTAAGPLVDALNRNSDLLERVIAGQEAAIAKFEGASGGSTTSRPRRRRATEDTQEAAEETQQQAAPSEPVKEAAHPLLANPNSETAKVKNNKTGEMEDAPTSNYRASDFSRDQVKAEFVGWLGETTDPEVRKERAAFVAAIGQHFGVKLPFHPTEGLATDEDRKQTLFFLRRKREGLKVDFSHDYDFDGDPLAEQTLDESEVGDFDALG